MKKLRLHRTALTVGLVSLLLLAMAVPAAAVKPVDPGKLQRLTWYAVPSGNSDVVSTDELPGHVSINTPAGEVTMIINGRITLDPNTTYGVWVRELTGYTGDYLTSYAPLSYYKLTTFTTNVRGQGSFHINIARGDLPDGTRDIQIAINPSLDDAYVGSTVAATVKFTPVRTG
ncbi:MAG: hypothetical protein A2V75_02895 [Actinobacteria bacterium RBG_16_70_17]|nr:MAG: hypothetical protein A2V75_02895 [Actinobacteria bacterium RBG_16_70_17]